MLPLSVIRGMDMLLLTDFHLTTSPTFGSIETL